MSWTQEQSADTKQYNEAFYLWNSYNFPDYFNKTPESRLVKGKWLTAKEHLLFCGQELESCWVCLRVWARARVCVRCTCRSQLLVTPPPVDIVPADWPQSVAPPPAPVSASQTGAPTGTEEREGGGGETQDLCICELDSSIQQIIHLPKCPDGLSRAQMQLITYLYTYV